jgi:putative ABC transport system permease protein
MSGLIQDLHYALAAVAQEPWVYRGGGHHDCAGDWREHGHFSVVNAVLLRPLPYKDDSRLVVILNKGRNPVAPANFIDWRSQSQSFSQMGAAEYWTPEPDRHRQSRKIVALHVTPDIFPMLGVQPWLGRMFLPEEQRPAKNMKWC